MNHREIFPGNWLPLVMVLLLAAGCSGKKAAGKDVGNDQKAETRAGEVVAEVRAGEVVAEVHAVTSATPRGKSFHLTEKHSGWRMAGCADCHGLDHGGLAPADLPDDYVASIDAMTMGLPAFVVYLGVDHDYAEEFPDFHEIILQDSHDPHDVFQSGLDCKPGDDLLLLIANYSRVDPTAAPAGKNVVTLTGLVGFDCFVDVWEDHEAYKEAKGQYAELFIQRAEEVLPSLSEHIEIMEVAAPQTTWAYTGNPNGSFVGFDTPPEQAILNRLPQETPIDNLYLAGAWTFPGGGQATVLLSGNFAADKVLAKESD